MRFNHTPYRPLALQYRSMLNDFRLAACSKLFVAWEAVIETRKLVPIMKWVFSVNLKRVNSARSSTEHAFSNFAPMQPSSLLHSSRSPQYTRSRACAEKEEYRRAISALSSEPLADTADPAMQDDLARLHPSPSTPATPVTHIESLAPAPRIKSSVIWAINRFDRTSAVGPDGVHSSILQTLLKYSEGEDP